MPSFQDQFMELRGEPIEWNGQMLHMADEIPIKGETRVVVKFISTNSNWRQGIGLDAKNATFECYDQVVKNRATFWNDTAEREIELIVRTKETTLFIKNIWVRDGIVESWVHGAAMIFEEIENGRRYYCNDGHPDENFDDIVFEVLVFPIERTEKPKTIRSEDKK